MGSHLQESPRTVSSCQQRIKIESRGGNPDANTMSPSPQALRRQAAAAAEVVDDLRDAVSRGLPADTRLARIYRAHREFGSRDRRLFSEAAFAFFRWRGWIEACTVDLGEQIALAWRLDGHPAHPALRPVDHLLTHAQSLDPSLLVPGWLAAHVAPGYLADLLRAFQRRPPVWLRARAGERDKILDALRESGIPATAHAAIPDAIGLEGSANLDLIRRRVGPAFEVQDLASQRVGLACAPRPGEAWWDVCAGAGGKSLHLADLMHNRGRILATDVRDSALAELRRRARASSLSIIEAAPITGHRSPVTLFDGVLVDAPCSGIGTWSRNPDARWRTNEHAIAEKAECQSDLLMKAAPHVKPGGSLIYAVCTVTREETQAVVDRFLAACPSFLPSPHSPTPPVLRVWPWEGPCDGMFIARMTRSAGDR
jgi:16S rRNA (cytosine967-C5)-methyltransferase